MLDITDITNASSRISSVIENKPLQYSSRLSSHYNAKVYLKREDLQVVRSYKIRGAYNFISQLEDSQKENGIVCASAGNHAQGVALTCFLLKIKGTIFMPETTPSQKINKVKSFGKKFVKINIVGNTFDDCSRAAQNYCNSVNATFVHPFNHEKIIAGQGTIAKEILSELDDVDLFLAPIGGGGVISGCSFYFKHTSPDTKIIGVEPNGAASAKTSINSKRVVELDQIDTFVDGAAVAKIGDVNFKYINQYVDDFITVDEGHICSTMIDLYQDDGIICEPAGALSVSALDQIADQIKGKVVVCLISGGNNDILRYPEILEKSMTYKGLQHYFIIKFKQKPGELKNLLNNVILEGIDITRFEYLKKNNKDDAPAFIGLRLLRKNQLNELLKRLDTHDIQYQKISTESMLYSYLV